MTTSRRNLDNVPFDIFYHIVRGLDCDDYINLSRVNKTIDSLMRNDLLARKTVESHMSQTKEARLAANGRITFRAAIGRRFEMKHAVASAKPFSIAQLACGSTYLYNEGILCYLFAGEIRVLDVHNAGTTESVLNLHNVLRRAISRLRTAESLESVRVSLLWYSAGILTISVELADGFGSWLIAMDLSRNRHKTGRIRLIQQLDINRHLFVRHNGRYLYYGVQISLASRELPQWAIHRVDLEKGLAAPLNDDPVIFEGLMGQDIGQNICFEIFKDHLYAVSNQTYIDEDDQDWTSYYVWYCLSPTEAHSAARMRRSWRRQHHEGPINDTWTTISLHESELTGEPTIYECRREWCNGSSDNVRSYYMQPLPFPSKLAECKELEYDGSERPDPCLHPELLGRPTLSPSSNEYSDVLPSNIILPRGLSSGRADESNAAVLLPVKKRPRRYVHCEYSDEQGPVQRKDFILAKTKYMTYNSSACSFVDLVNDPSHGYSMAGQSDRLRLRINPRKRKWADTRASSCENQDSDGDGDGDTDRFISPGVQLWPSEADSQEISELLCPAGKLRGLEAMSDERSIVYSVDTSNGDNRAIILLNFDPQIKFRSMRRPGQVISNPEESPESKSPSPVGSPSSPSFRVERALYFSIDKGLWLR